MFKEDPCPCLENFIVDKSLANIDINKPPDMEGWVEVSHPVVHDGQQPVDWAHDPLHGDAEQQQREGDPEQRIDHAEHLPRGGERGLLAVTCTPKQLQVKSVLKWKQ